MSKVLVKKETETLSDRKTSSTPKSRTSATSAGIHSGSRTSSPKLKKLPPIENGKSPPKPFSRVGSARGESIDGIPSSTQDVLRICQESDCLKVLDVDLHGYKLKTICNLTKFTRIQNLDLSGNFLIKIEGLDANQQLKQLKLYDNKITTVENLDCQSQLSDLQLQYNSIICVGSGLTVLRNLASLRLDNNKLTSISSRELAAVSKTLKYLDLSRNKLSDISAIVSLKILEELYVGGNKITTLPSLKNLEKLTEFDCSDNGLTSLRGVENCNSLTSLIVSRNKFKPDVFTQFQGSLDQLDRFDSSGNKIVDLAGLDRAFPNLSILNLSQNEICESSQVLSCGLGRLAEMDLRENPVVLDLSRLCEAFPTLELVDGRPVRPSGMFISHESLNIHPIGARMEQQIREYDTALSFEYDDMLSRFKSIRQNMEFDLPTGKPEEDRPASKCRGRLEDAKKFSESNYRE